ncbi:MAG: hypothetical protein Q7T46_11665 [Polaromonas sp.]|nr:hypothetical protein [Polaromonas sp.]
MDAIRKIEAAFDAEFICYEFPSEQQRDTAMTLFRLGYRAGSASKEAELVRLRSALSNLLAAAGQRDPQLWRDARQDAVEAITQPPKEPT